MKPMSVSVATCSATARGQARWGLTCGLHDDVGGRALLGGERVQQRAGLRVDQGQALWLVEAVDAVVFVSHSSWN